MAEQGEELTLETVTAIEPDQLSDEHKTFLQDHKEELNDEQRTKYGIDTFTDEGDEPPLIVDKKDKDGEGDDGKGKKGKDDDEDEDDLDDEDKKKIGKLIDKRLTPLQRENQEYREAQKVEKIKAEMQSIIDKNPAYKEYAARIERWVNHPNRIEMIKNGLPVNTVVIEAIAPYLERIGAQKKAAADEAAARTKDAGGTQRKTGGGGKPDYSKMTDSEIAEIGEQVKSGRYQA